VIGVERRGRLGNQLFQFAFGIAASQRLQTSFVMADHELRELFTLGPYRRPSARVRRSLRYRLDKTLRPYAIRKIDNRDFDRPRDVMESLSDRTHYAGFFQSEDFFFQAREAVRTAFTALPRHVAAFADTYAALLERPYVCCHVRRTDYLEWLGGAALPWSYYAEALHSLAADDIPIVFVGDDLSDVRQAFGGRANVRFEENDEIIDLLLLAHADAVVTSNSSFGWWGAWLGRSDRTVVAPRYWLGFKDGHEYPPAVVPSRWTQIAVRDPVREGS
jgi:Glycosyl transferase family 11